MTTIALVDPLDLVGRELREELERRTAGSDVRLLTTDEEKVGTVSEFARSARLVARCDAQGLEGVDLAFVCHPAGLTDPERVLPPAASAIFLGGGGPDEARAALAWRTPDEPEERRWWISPGPAVVGLARLLEPLAALGDLDATATIILPASTLGSQAMDELFAQTRALLAFERDLPSEILGSQLAFNLLPAPEPGPEVGPLVAELLGMPGSVAVQSLLGGAFHGLAISAAVSFAGDPGPAAVADALAGAPGLLAAEEPGRLGPVDVASQVGVLVGDVVTQPRRTGSYWLWAVADNLTGIGAHHAVALAEAVGTL